MHIFPEGTILHPKTTEQSHKYAKEHGLPQYHYTLHPKTRGFCFTARHMLNLKSLNAIYDITVGYVGNIPETEVEIMTQGLPKEIQFKIKRHAIEELPQTDEGLEKWLQQIWQKKEAELTKFDQTKRLSEEFKEFRISNFSLGLAMIAWTGLLCQ